MEGFCLWARSSGGWLQKGVGSPGTDAGSLVGGAGFGVDGCRSRSGVPDLVLVGGPIPGMALWGWGCGLDIPKFVSTELDLGATG